MQQAFKATPLYRDDPAAVMRAQLSAPGSLISRALLLVGTLGLVLVLLAVDAWCLRDIWRAWRPQRHGQGEVVELSTRRVA